MTSPRRRTRDASDDEFDLPSRVVTPRRSLFTEDSDPEEEPIEDEEEPRPTRSSSSLAVPPSVPSSPIIPSSPILPNSTFTTRRQIDVLRWDWMPDILKRWRRAEQIPILPEVPSPYTPIPPLTQEHVHQTIPVLITRLLTHDHQLDQLEQAAHDRMDLPTSEVELLQHQVSRVESELTELRDMMVDSHNEGAEEVGRLRQQLEESQQRISEMEQEMALMRADRDQLRRVTTSMTRMVELLEGMDERLG